MVEESYVSFETARLLKEKGFAGECDWYYPKDGWEIEQLDLYELNYCRESFIEAPSLALVMRWLREVRGILLWMYPVIPLSVPQNKKEFNWEWDGKKQLHSAIHFGDKQKYKSYEEAAEAAIKYCLENLI